MKIAVVGCGYVGLITAVGLASKGHSVLVIDINKSHIEQISYGIVPFYEPGVTKKLKDCLHRKTLSVSTSLQDVATCEVVFICVQTPPKKSGAIDLKILKVVARDLASVFEHNPLARTVVIRSTVVPGTTDRLVTPIFQKSGLASPTEIAVNPEFLREGSALKDFFNPDRIVIGTHSKKASKMLSKLYAPFDTSIIVTTPPTAELSKYASNTLLATLISFSNEIARICERTTDTDVEEVLGIVHRDRRFRLSTDGAVAQGILSYLKAGCGFGGSCLPKDLSAFIAYASSKKEKTPLLNAVAAVNATQLLRVVDMAFDVLGGLTRRRIAVLGVAFKGGTDDLRESPGLKIVDELLNKKTHVVIYDPLVNSKLLKSYTEKGVVIASTLTAAIKQADACIVASNATEFRKLKSLKKSPFGRNLIIIDGRRILKMSKDEQKKYYAIGLSKEGFTTSSM